MRVRAEDAVGNEEGNMVERCVTNVFDFSVAGGGRGDNGNPEFTWVTLPSDFYRISSCSNLLSPQWEVEQTVPSSGGFTSWQPTNFVHALKFYSFEIADDYD